MLAMDAMRQELENMRRTQEEMLRTRMEMMSMTAEHFAKQMEAQSRGAAQAIQGVAQAAEGMMTTLAVAGAPKVPPEEHSAEAMDIDEEAVYMKLDGKLDKDLVKKIRMKASTLKKSLDRVAREEKR